MNTPQPSKPPRWFSGRTRLITIVSVVAVGIAGATAVSANIGILDAASGSEVGNVAAAGDLTPPVTQVVDVYLPAETSPSTSTTAAPTADASRVQAFTVDAAGTVSVVPTDSGLRLDSVAPATGWTWSATQDSEHELTVTMTNGVRTLEFVAGITPDGNIAASVNEATPAPPVTTTSGHDDEGNDHEYEGGEDDD